MFAEQSDVRRLIYTILMHSQSLLTCQRCQILLVHNLKEDTVSWLFMLQLFTAQIFTHYSVVVYHASI